MFAGQKQAWDSYKMSENINQTRPQDVTHHKAVLFSLSRHSNKELLYKDNDCLANFVY